MDIFRGKADDVKLLAVHVADSTGKDFKFQNDFSFEALAYISMFIKLRMNLMMITHQLYYT